MLEPFFSLIRILLLVLSGIMLKEFSCFQLLFSHFSMTFMIIYVGLSNCYISKTHNFFEQFNEFFVAITTYHLMCFADFIKDESTLEIMGLSLISCVSFNLIVNLSFIITNCVKDSYFKLRKAYYVAKHKRLCKRLMKRQAQMLA